MISSSIRHAIRFSAAILAAVVALSIIAIALLFAVLNTEAGQRFVAERTEAAVGRLLGPHYTIRLDDQHVGFGPEGTLAVRWQDAELARLDAPDQSTHVESIEVGLKLWPLLANKLALDHLAVRGAAIDVGGLLPPLPGEPRQDESEVDAPQRIVGLADALVQHLRDQTQLFARFDFHLVTLEDIELTGLAALPIPARSILIRSSRLERDSTGSIRLASTAEVDGFVLPLSGRMVVDPRDGRFQWLELGATDLDLGAVMPPTEEPGARKPIATDAHARLSLVIDDREPNEGYDLRFSGGLGDGTIQVGKAKTIVRDAELNVSHREGDGRFVVEPSPMAFEGVSFDLVGAVSAERPAGQKPGPMAISLATRNLRSTIGLAPGQTQAADFSLEAELDLPGRVFNLSEISIGSDKNALVGSGRAEYGSPDGTVRARFDTVGIDTATVKAFWPFMLSSETRGWILDHFGDGGRVTGGSIVLNFDRQGLQRALDPDKDPNEDELQLDVDLENVDFGTLGDMPHLSAVSGHVATRGPHTAVSVEQAKVDGFANVAVEPSSINFAKQPDRTTLANLSLALSGAADELLSIADLDPVNALRKEDISASDFSGNAQVQVEVELVLGRQLEEKDRLRSWSVGFQLDKVDIAKPVDGRNLSELSGTGTVLPDRITGELGGKLDGLPATFSVVHPLREGADLKETITIGLLLTGDEIHQAMSGLSDIVDGTVTGTVVHEADRDTASFDLENAELTLPWVGWSKGKGVAAGLTFDLVSAENGTELKNVVLSGQGFEARGEMILDGKGLRSASFDKVALNPNDDISFGLQRVANGLSLRVGGKRFDARSLLQDIRSDLATEIDSADRPSDTGDQLDIGVTIDRVTGFGDSDLIGFMLNYAGTSREIAALSVAAKTTTGGKVAVDIAPRNGAQALSVTSSDTGAMLAFTGLYEHMRGGGGSLQLIGSGTTGYRGRLQLQDFTLVDEPRLSSLVTATPDPERASLAGALGRDIETERAFFDHASANITYGARRLMVEDGIVRGPVFGSSFAGTLRDEHGRIDISGSFMPAYGVNRIFGAIPLFGQILGNGNEGGLIGITYRLAGAFSSPTLTVNPISAIAPGIFRRIFEY
ncbi:hypothetical protein [Consotaella aegiceratis]|uniref:hypothetical protein n=1 Tax=Consotaella aegiceratis TaxID=3097961 RepID=UPI002F418841